eukprot:7772901-Pyramimonas_sp.AAC.1
MQKGSCAIMAHRHPVALTPFNIRMNNGMGSLPRQLQGVCLGLHMGIYRTLAGSEGGSEAYDRQLTV